MHRPPKPAASTAPSKTNNASKQPASNTTPVAGSSNTGRPVMRQYELASSRTRDAHHKAFDDQTDAASEASFQMTPEQWDAFKHHESTELEEFRRMEQAALMSSPFSSRFAVKASAKEPSLSFDDHLDVASMPREAVDRRKAPSAAPLHAPLFEDEPFDSLDEGDDDDTVVSQQDAMALSTSNRTVAVAEFDDREAWGDTPNTPQARIVPQKQVYRGEEHSQYREPPSVLTEQADSPPPRSQLVERLFQTQQSGKGSHAPKSASNRSSEAAKQPKADETIKQASQVDELVKAKLQELEDEIARFKHENAELAKLKHTKETELRSFRKEVQEFASHKAEELESFQKYRDDELRKLKRDRMVFETHVENFKSRPDKKQRDEIEELKAELSRVRQEMAEKEQRSTLAVSRYKDKIQQLTDRNAELENELQVLEQARLSDWKGTTVPSATGKAAPSTKAESKLVASQAIASKGLSMKSFISLCKSRPSIVTEASQPRQVPAVVARAEAAPEAVPTIRIERHVAVKPEATNVLTMLPDMQEEQGSKSLSASGRTETVLPDGIKVVQFKNGTRKEMHPNGYVVVRFFNGDVKETFANKQVTYYYAESHTTHTTFPDGMEVIEFANSQLEKRHVDGTQEIVFPDQTVKLLYTNGEEETIFPDGTVQRITPSGERVVEFPNGQREIHTSQFKKRRYPNGTSKIVYPDGRQETQYPNGRVRVKDKDGFVLVDTMPADEVADKS